MDIRDSFCRVVEAAGLDSNLIVRHTLRHTAITHLVQAGVDLPTVKRISGHKTLAMVERYAHANGAHIQGAMDRLQDRLNIAPNSAESLDSAEHDYTETTQTDKRSHENESQPLELLVGRARFELATNGLKVLVR